MDVGKQAQRLGGLGFGLKIALWAAFVMAWLGSTTGCTRSFFRKQADEEAAAVLAEKDKYADWRIDQFHVYPDPRARFADPTNPDCPPKPPDDPAAYDLAPNPQKPGKAGVAKVDGDGYLALLAKWDEENRAKIAGEEKKKAAARLKANPSGPKPEKITAPPVPAANQLQPPQVSVEPSMAAQAAAKVIPAGGYTATILDTPVMPGVALKPGQQRPYLINLEQAVELAQINSREFQDAREDLYLASLPVTLERFSFAAQFFAAGQLLRQWAGIDTPEAAAAQANGDSRNNWQANSNVGFSKLFSTGALLLFNFANQTAFNLGGGVKPVTSQSTIDLSMVQPLLQGAGQAVNLEPLTQAERNLLYQIRSFARFRKTLYVAIAGGGGGALTGATFQPVGVVASPTFSADAGFGPTLIPGLIPQQVLTGNAGLTVRPGTSGQISLQTALAAPVSGYLSTLLQVTQMQVDKYNIEKLEGFLSLAKALQEGGDISQLQTDQFEQSLLRGRQSLLSDQQQYLQALEQFKLQLGLPVGLLIVQDDAPFRPMNAQFERYEDLFHAFTEASREPFQFNGFNMISRVRPELLRILTTADVVRGTQFQAQIAARWRAFEKMSGDDLGKLEKNYKDEKRKLLNKQTDLEMQGQRLSAADQKRLAAIDNDLELMAFEQTLRHYESQPWKKLTTPTLQQEQQKKEFGYLVNDFTVLLIEARNERMTQLHNMWPDLSKLCLEGADLLQGSLDEAQAKAAQYALTHRLDLMNVRAQVVDSWRQIRIFANALLAPVSVQYNLTSTTPAGAAQPMAFSGSRTQQQLLLNFQLPLVRVQERNNYRAALISYQRARRILQRAEDETATDVRQELIVLRQYLENYKIQTRQVELGYLTVENSLDTLQAPPQPGAVIDTATRAASLAGQLITAQTNLYTAHTNMTTFWISYLNERDQLYRDLELMPFDNRGVWIDENATDCSAGGGGRAESGSGCGAADQRSEQRQEPHPAAPAQEARHEQAH